MLNELDLGLYYPSNDTKNVIFGSKITEKLGIPFKIELVKGESNMVDGVWGGRDAESWDTMSALIVLCNSGRGDTQQEYIDQWFINSSRWTSAVWLVVTLLQQYDQIDVKYNFCIITQR